MSQRDNKGIVKMDALNEFYDQIGEEVIKLFSTAMGLIVSLLFGEDLFLKISSPNMGWAISYLIEVLSKSGIAVFSGVFTYLAIYGIKKALKHTKD